MNVPARYTEVLKNLMDNEQTRPLIEQALSTYPLYQQRTTGEFIPVHIPTREELNNAILNHYKYREIGFETVGRFLDELKTAMCEIMPYYNQLFFSVDQDYNILENANYTREITREREKTDEKSIEGSENDTGTSSETAANTSKVTSEGSGSATTSSTTESETNSTNKHVESATPQGQIGIVAQNIDSVSYADNVSWDKNGATDSATNEGESSNTSESETNTTANGTISRQDSATKTNNISSDGTENELESTLEKLRGNYGMVTYQSLIEKYRELIINVTQKIINDKRVQELFMLVY